MKGWRIFSEVLVDTSPIVRSADIYSIFLPLFQHHSASCDSPTILLLLSRVESYQAKLYTRTSWNHSIGPMPSLLTVIPSLLALPFWIGSMTGISHAFLRPNPKRYLNSYNKNRKRNSGSFYNRNPNHHHHHHHHDGPPSPPSEPPISWSGSLGGEEPYDGFVGTNGLIERRNDTTVWHHRRPSQLLRGGSTSTKKKSSDDLVKGSQAAIAKTTTFWKTSMDNVRQRTGQLFKSKEQKKQEELLEQLKTMPIRAVSVPNTTVLPPDVISMAVKRSGLIGSPLRTDRVQELARNLKRYYARKGYVLHTVTGATLNANTATAEIEVEEPEVSRVPVGITACKEMVIDSESGELMTFRQYREKHVQKKTFGYDRIEKKDLNTTFVETEGRTKPSRIAKALQLHPGKPFQWDGTRWQKIVHSGVFSRVLRAAPERLPDGTVKLQMYVTEPPPRHLEYGLGKSLYTGSWEGEIDFEHKNLFGGGETVALMVRRGTKDAEPSIRVRFSDEKFGLEGGYDIEAFNDFIGDSKNEEATPGKGAGEMSPSTNDENYDALLHRRGATFRLNNPINAKHVHNSVASVSLERTSTTTGIHENIGSATLTIGPFRQYLPMDARSSVSTSITGGSRFAEKDISESPSRINIKLLPYSSISATTRQVLPLTTPREGRPPVTLALQHTAATSTFNLPRHEANAMSISAQIRGASPDGRSSSTVKGTTELRVPVSVPRLGEAAVVLFGDWFYVQSDPRSPFYSKSSIGVGVRKNVQGLPLKFDVCYSSEGKIKQMFGLGSDFEA